MKITIVYDNTAFIEGFSVDWGFSCLIEAHEKKILFDTGAKGEVLLKNMAKLGVSPQSLDGVFISHTHWDHSGGLAELLKVKPLKVFIPDFCPEVEGADSCVRISGGVEIFDNIYSTGTLDEAEQSLVICQEKDTVVVVGCAHPGVGEVLAAAEKYGKATVLLGGLHGFDDLSLLSDLRLVCPAHCTQYSGAIDIKYPDKFVPAGVGQIIEI
jgi:7,8-dihydropterin-6-yl-methyl-4-(beta-D-ribofuranosyl)aminobenzene 5'-phosphate synthase